MKPRRVVFYGKNLIMSAIAARLQQKAGFEVSQIEGSINEVVEKLRAVPTDVVVFDWAAEPQFAIPLLKSNPALLLIGVDLGSDKMLVFSGQQSRFLTAEDLMKVIELTPSPTLNLPAQARRTP